MDQKIMLLMQLLTQKSFLTLKDVELALKGTRRQVIYRIDKLNDLIKGQNVPPVFVDSTAAKNIKIENSTKKVLQNMLVNMQEHEEQYYFNKQERLIYMYLMLFINMDYLSLNHFIDALSVSRSTVLADLKELTTALEEKEVYIEYNRKKGYHLVGSEMEIRRNMMRYVIQTRAKEKNEKIFDLFIEDYCLEKFDYSRKIIVELSQVHKIHFVEERLIEFIYIYTFLIARMKSGKDATEEINCLMELDTISSMKEYEFTVDLLKYYEEIESITQADVYYISSWVLGISFGDVYDETKDATIIADMVGKMMSRFESLSGARYHNTEEIFIQLYSHFRPAYYRMLFKLPIFNPLCEKIKEEYKELYQLVNETMKPFSVIFGETIPEDEIAYLTMHFAAIYSGKKKSEIVKQKIALVVCSNGIESSAILYNELSGLFPELKFLPPIEFRHLKEYEKDADIIFATGHVFDGIHLDVPVIRVSPVMSISERYQVVREVYMQLGSDVIKKPDVEEVINIVSKYADIKNEKDLYYELLRYFSKIDDIKPQNKNLRLCDMVDPKIIRLNVEAKDWEEAIRLSYEPMVREGYITQNYVEDTIKGVKLLGPYIVTTKHIALSHSKPEMGAIKEGLGIAVLKNPVEFGSKDNDPVKYIFSLSAIENEKHLGAMGELVELFNDQEFYDLLDRTDNIEEIIEYLKAIQE